MAEPATPPWFRPPAPHIPTDKTATVIGAGLAGCSAAFHLASLGWKVNLLEKNCDVASATSGNPAGLVKPQVISQDILKNHYLNINYQYFIIFLKNLLHICPDLHHDFSGLFETRANAHKNSSNKNKFDQSFHFIENAGWLCPADFCLAQTAAFKSISVQTNCTVAKLEKTGANWLCLDANVQCITESPVVVVANGDAISDFTQTRCLPLEPLSGQVTLLSADALSPPVKQVFAGKHYLIPLPGGTYLCGATNRRGRSTTINAAGHASNLHGLSGLLPEVAIDSRQIIGGRTGVRSVSPDHLPVVGAVPDWRYYKHHYETLHHGRRNESFPQACYQPGLYVIAGLGSHGIATSPYLGKLLGDIICRRADSEIDEASVRLLHPARFLIRQLRRKPVDRSIPAG